MFYSNHPQEIRKQFLTSWQKHLAKLPLSALEAQIAAVIQDHPEYHALFEKEDLALQQQYYPELGQTNPFLHLGLHLAIRDQIQLDRPVGVKAVFQKLLIRYADPLAIEHLLMECLAECLWQAQRSNEMPDETAYLKACENLIESK